MGAPLGGYVSRGSASEAALRGTAPEARSLRSGAAPAVRSQADRDAGRSSSAGPGQGCNFTPKSTVNSRLNSGGASSCTLAGVVAKLPAIAARCTTQGSGQAMSWPSSL